MSKTKTYRQCTLHKQCDNGITTTVSYIPTQFAVEGSILKLKQDDDSWDDGWRVVRAGKEIDAEYVEKNEMNYRRQRQASDI